MLALMRLMMVLTYVVASAANDEVERGWDLVPEAVTDHGKTW